METTELIAKEIDEKPVEIYSKLAIRGFSIFFAPIFGGVLLTYNLRKAGNKKAANQVLIFSIIYTAVSVIFINNLNTGNRSVVYLVNIIGGVILSDYFYKKYFPDDNYYKKPIWKALIISILITIPFVLALILTA